MIGYTMVGTNNLPRAIAFYDAVFKVVDVGQLMPMRRGMAWGPNWNAPLFAVTKPHDEKPATAGNGTMIALMLDTRAKVDALYAAAIAAGGADEGAPGVRGEEGSQAFYGAYFRDLDGNKICAYRMGPP
jgi:catechol 2,3-dioxygenase-like lactoylglutathione lyase family enzyme